MQLGVKKKEIPFVIQTRRGMHVLLGKIWGYKAGWDGVIQWGFAPGVFVSVNAARDGPVLGGA